MSEIATRISPPVQVPSKRVRSHALTIYAGTLASVVTLLLWQPQEWPAWCVVLISFAPIFVDSEIRRRPFALWAVFGVIVAHHLVSIANVYAGPLPGAQIDARQFHDLAVAGVEGQGVALDVGWPVYVRVLEGIYTLFGPSLLLGQATSVLAFGLSCSVMVRVVRRCGAGDCAWLLLLVYGLLPPSLLITSLTFRESWQLLFFLCAAWFGVRHIDESKIRWLTLSVLFALLMGILHKALLGISVVLVMTAWLCEEVPRLRQTAPRRALLTRWCVAIVVAIAAGQFPRVRLEPSSGGCYRAFTSIECRSIFLVYHVQHSTYSSIHRTWGAHCWRSWSITGITCSDRSRDPWSMSWM